MESIDSLKLPPHSIEAEQSVIGGLLLENDAWERIAGSIGTDDFYRDDHRLIYRQIVEMIEQGKPADIVTVSEALAGRSALERTGGLPYLAALAQNTPSTANIHRYAEIVREHGILRKLIHATSDIAKDAYSPMGRHAKEILDEAEARIFEIAEAGSGATQGFLKLSPLLGEVVERIDMLFHRDNPDDVTGISTGFAELDKMTAGLQPGDLIVVAARPSMGKTAFALNIGEHVAISLGLPVAVFSMEMSGVQLATRLIGSTGRLSHDKLRTGRFNSDDDWNRLTNALGKLNDAPLFIDEGAGLTALQVRAQARRLSRQNGKLGLIIIDYIQLMTSSARSENRNAEISEISRSLKALAKELGVPIIALSQLNRGVEQRQDKHPVMSDLRESGAIEQDADVILFIYRDEKYNPDSADKGKAEIIVSKQRNGPTGKIQLAFLGEFTRFENLGRY